MERKINDIEENKIAIERFTLLLKLINDAIRNGENPLRGREAKYVFSRKKIDNVSHK